MLVVENNTKSYYYNTAMIVRPLEYFGECMVVIDPSKTNMAVLIGDYAGNVLSVIEFSGNNRRKGPAQDTTEYCLEVRKFILEYLSNCNVTLVGVEQAVGYEGMNHYRSSLVLTEIRANILGFFRENMGVQVIEINNWSWKAGVLPAGYRSQSEKGSKRFICDTYPNTIWTQFFEADVTDVLCMYWYMLQTGNTHNIVCQSVEQPRVNFSYYFEPARIVTNIREVVYNDVYSVMDNCHYYVNRIFDPFCMPTPASSVPIDIIYGHCTKFELSDISPTAMIRMVVGRCA